MVRERFGRGVSSLVGFFGKERKDKVPTNPVSMRATSTLPASSINATVQAFGSRLHCNGQDDLSDQTGSATLYIARPEGY